MTEQERVAALAERARRALAIGMAVLEAEENRPSCPCFYDDGQPKYVTPDRKPVHRCGR